MIAAEPFGLLAQVFAVEEVVARDLFTINDEDGAQAVPLFKLKGVALLPVEKGVDGPGGAGKNAGRIAGGGHRCNALVVDTRRNVLGLVDDEESIGGRADHTGRWVGSEVGDAGREKSIDMTVLSNEAAGGEEGTLRGTGLQAIHRIKSLRAEGGLGADDGGAAFGQAGEEKEDEDGEELVLAGLAGEDQDEGLAITPQDGAGDGIPGFELIGIEVDADEARRESLE